MTTDIKSKSSEQWFKDTQAEYREVMNQLHEAQCRELSLRNYANWIRDNLNTYSRKTTGIAPF